MVLHAYNPRTWKEGTGGALGLPEHPDLHSEFQTSQGYIVTPCIKI